MIRSFRREHFLKMLTMEIFSRVRKAYFSQSFFMCKMISSNGLYLTVIDTIYHGFQLNKF